MRVGSHPSARCARTKKAFLQLRSLEEAVSRAHRIAALPSKIWKGTRVYRVRCQADFGKGPHDQYLTPAWLWGLIDLDAYRCPYH